MDDARMATRHGRPTRAVVATGVWGVAGALSAIAVLVEGNIAAGGPWGACGSGSRWPTGSAVLFIGVLIMAGAVQSVAWRLAYGVVIGLNAHRLARVIAVVAACTA